MGEFGRFRSNPAEYMMNKYGIDKSIANDPDAIIQKMMQEGRLSQQQYNQARQMASQFQNSPMFRNFRQGK